MERNTNYLFLLTLPRQGDFWCVHSHLGSNSLLSKTLEQITKHLTLPRGGLTPVRGERPGARPPRLQGTEHQGRGAPFLSLPFPSQRTEHPQRSRQSTELGSTMRAGRMRPRAGSLGRVGSRFLSGAALQCGSTAQPRADPRAGRDGKGKRRLPLITWHAKYSSNHIQFSFSTSYHFTCNPGSLPHLPPRSRR